MKNGSYRVGVGVGLWEEESGGAVYLYFGLSAQVILAAANPNENHSQVKRKCCTS